MIQAIKNLNFLKKWYVIDSQTAKEKDNKTNSMKFETESVKSSLCDYPGAYTLVTGDITVNSGIDTEVLLKNWAPFLDVRQKFMKILLIKEIIFPLQCLCTI